VSSATAPLLTPADVEAAAARLHGVVVRTPVVRHDDLDLRTGAEVWLKAESLQRGGAFKYRGASNRILQLTEAERRRGVITVSSGNHAQAVALAAARLGVPARILMPEDAPQVKVAGTVEHGARVERFDRYGIDRDELLAERARETGATVVHPYDEPAVMAGQGTVALELLEQAGPLDALLVCVGGGGLMAGCATWAKAQDPGVRMVGVEPEAGDDTRRSLAAGRRVEIPVPRTIADGQQLPVPGRLTWEVNRRLVDEVAVASDDELRAAMAWAFDRLRLVLEPSGACALAALMAGRVPDLAGRRVGVTLSGGNVDRDRFVALTAGL
jgi:threonine dehydratase